MRSALMRTLVSATAVIGIATGSLAGAGASLAAPQPGARTAAATQEVSVLAVNNLGLSTWQAQQWQCFLDDQGFDPGTIDGKLGTSSWRAAQKAFNAWQLEAGRVDGIVGPDTIKALQRFLGVPVDGIAGPQTKKAFKDFANLGGCG
ncbi:peptidoglycan-binding domain-containing protein [Streptomyces sp. NPDC059900]|uniref:peptidoglycan-binding domain-containing protein n=1 Tax=Streptomyces sp. NPDC059900 TaxID=3155816 RepID=UPI003434D78B